MAKCKLCKKEIADGTEYCNDCIDKKETKNNETYLDSLLNSVQGAVTNTSDLYKKKKDNSNKDDANSDSLSISMELEDLKDFDQFDITKDLDDPIVISNEDLYGGGDTSNNEDSVEEVATMEDSEEVAEDEEFVEDFMDNIFQESDSEESNDEYNSDEEIDNFNISDMLGNSNEDLDETASALTTDDDRIESDLSPEYELLNLLNQFNPEDPMDDDVQAISDLLGGIDEKNKKETEYPEDVGLVFHEALEAVTDLDDPDHGIQQLSKDIEPLQDIKEDKKKKKKSFFSRIFGNVEYDESDIKKIEAKKAAAEAKKLKNKNKKSKTEEVTELGETEESTDTDQKKLVPNAHVKAQAKAQARAEKKKARQEKKELKKIKVIETTDDEDEGRINPVGASIVFVFFGLVVILVLVSTNLFSYSLSVKNATNYFDRQRYTQAYNEVYGIDIKDEDIELYDKIMTVMFVNKQLNSYNNYYHMRKYPEALDSLLKGLERYDKYVELATMLGIKTDLDYVRNQMIAELYNVFSLSEEEAINILNNENQLEYSIAVYDVVLENISFY